MGPHWFAVVDDLRSGLLCRGDDPGLAVANALEVVDFAQDQFDALEHMLTRLGDALKAFAMPGKNLDAEFFFEFDDGLGHTRLRSVQGLGGFGEVQVAARGLLDKSELMQVHTQTQLKNAFIMHRSSSGPGELAVISHLRELQHGPVAGGVAIGCEMGALQALVLQPGL